MKIHVILLASAFLFTSGCAFKESGPAKKAAASALSEAGFSGSLSALLDPSIQAVVPNAIALDDGATSFILTVVGTNLGYRNNPNQPTQIAAPLLMSLGDGCECASGDPASNFTANVLQTNQDSLTCTIRKATCQTGAVNRNLTITRLPASGAPQTVTSYGAVQFLTQVPFQLGGFTVNCTGGDGQPANGQTSNVFCRSDKPVTVMMSGSNLAGGQLRLGGTICSSLNYSGTTGFSCQFQPVCTVGSCSITSLPLIYAQSGYSFNFGVVGFLTPFTITGMSPSSAIATEKNSVQIYGTNLSSAIKLKIDGKSCTTVHNTSTTADCEFDSKIFANKAALGTQPITYHLDSQSFSAGGLHPTNAVSINYTLTLNQMSVNGIRVYKDNDFLPSRVIAADQSAGTQSFVVTGSGFENALTTGAVSIIDPVSGAELVTPTCAASGGQINCQFNAVNYLNSGFSGVRAKVFGIKIKGNDSTWDYQKNYVFEVWGRKKESVESTTTNLCRENDPCWVDNSVNRFEFSDSKPQVWNKYITILFSTIE